MIEYLEKKCDIVDSLAENLNLVSTEDLIGYILNGINSSYGLFTAAFMMEDSNPSVDDLIGLIRSKTRTGTSLLNNCNSFFIQHLHPLRSQYESESAQVQLQQFWCLIYSIFRQPLF